MKSAALYIHEYIHAIQPSSLSLQQINNHTSLALHTKEKPCGAQDRKSVRGVVSVSKHHHTAPHLSWDSTTLHHATHLFLSVITITDLFFPSFYYVLL